MSTTEEPRTRLRLLLEYDGTGFAGFQLQGKGERTVQQELEAALHRITGETIRVQGAGRTDAGVHALGQVAHCDVTWRIPEAKIAAALNANLPSDLTIRSATVAEASFHARYSATSRVYRYAILNREQPSALLGRYSWHLRQPLQLEAMRAAAAQLIGIQDFAAFGQPDAPGKSTVRSVTRLEVRRYKACVLITVEGNAFLRQMVRSFVGTLVVVGQGRLTPEGVRALRESRDRGACPPVAPAKGLCLTRVLYDGVRFSPEESA